MILGVGVGESEGVGVMVAVTAGEDSVETTKVPVDATAAGVGAAAAIDAAGLVSAVDFLLSGCALPPMCMNSPTTAEPPENTSSGTMSHRQRRNRGSGLLLNVGPLASRSPISLDSSKGFG